MGYIITGSWRAEDPSEARRRATLDSRGVEIWGGAAGLHTAWGSEA